MRGNAVSAVRDWRVAKMAASFSATKLHSTTAARPKSARHLPPLPDSPNKFSVIDKLSHSASWKMMPTV
ncbi:MAG: hypothetical protein M3136_12925 [Thermoproteota archaeon]|nr:hypothetical protein [Thermoproteota archaeon]